MCVVLINGSVVTRGVNVGALTLMDLHGCLFIKCRSARWNTHCGQSHHIRGKLELCPGFPEHLHERAVEVANVSSVCVIITLMWIS